MDTFMQMLTTAFYLPGAGIDVVIDSANNHPTWERVTHVFEPPNKQITPFDDMLLCIVWLVVATIYCTHCFNNACIYERTLITASDGSIRETVVDNEAVTKARRIKLDKRSGCAVALIGIFLFVYVLCTKFLYTADDTKQKLAGKIANSLYEQFWQDAARGMVNNSVMGRGVMSSIIFDNRLHMWFMALLCLSQSDWVGPERHTLVWFKNNCYSSIVYTLFYLAKIFLATCAMWPFVNVFLQKFPGIIFMCLFYTHGYEIMTIVNCSNAFLGSCPMTRIPFWSFRNSCSSPKVWDS